MLRTLFASFLAALALSAAFAEEKPKEPAKEAKKIDGSWIVESAEMDGKDIAKTFEKTILKIDGKKYTFEIDGKEDAGSLSIDEKKTPMEMDITGGKDSPLKDKTIPCIYHWDGDNFVICYGMDFKTRPTEFKTKDGSKRMLVTYKPKK